jgi:hypothetical protein
VLDVDAVVGHGLGGAHVRLLFRSIAFDRK